MLTYTARPISITFSHHYQARPSKSTDSIAEMSVWSSVAWRSYFVHFGADEQFTIHHLLGNTAPAAISISFQEREGRERERERARKREEHTRATGRTAPKHKLSDEGHSMLYKLRRSFRQSNVTGRQRMQAAFARVR